MTGDGRPGWSFTWLLRIQRRRPPGDDSTPRISTFWKIVPWIIAGAIAIELAVFVWMDILPL